MDCRVTGSLRQSHHDRKTNNGGWMKGDEMGKGAKRKENRLFYFISWLFF